MNAHVLSANISNLSDNYKNSALLDDLKKNILTRAFGGILGTNDPNEENSIELLKTVL